MKLSLGTVLILILLFLPGCAKENGLVNINGHVYCITYSGCTSHIESRILRKWRDPKTPEAMVEKVVFKLHLSEHGTIEYIRMVGSSGDEEIDNIALGALNHAAPFLELTPLDLVTLSKYSRMIVEFDPNTHDVVVKLS